MKGQEEPSLIWGYNIFGPEMNWASSWMYSALVVGGGGDAKFKIRLTKPI